jgi:hypothetical protein
VPPLGALVSWLERQAKSLDLTSEIKQITTRSTEPRPSRDRREDRREPPVLTVQNKQSKNRSQSPAPRGRSSSHQQRRNVVQNTHVKFAASKRYSQPAAQETGRTNSRTQRAASPFPRRSASPNSRASSPHAAQCSVCDSTLHRTNQCPEFLGYSVNERRDWIRSHNRCFNCLGKHSSKDCTSKYTCGKCQKRHHTLIHTDEPLSPVMTMFTTNAHGSDSSCTGILPTAIVTVTNAHGNDLDQARCLLDSGAERCFITVSAVQRLGLKVLGRTQQFAVAGGRTTLSMGYTTVAFRNRLNPSVTSPIVVQGD